MKDVVPSCFFLLFLSKFSIFTWENLLHQSPYVLQQTTCFRLIVVDFLPNPKKDKSCIRMAFVYKAHRCSPSHWRDALTRACGRQFPDPCRSRSCSRLKDHAGPKAENGIRLQLCHLLATSLWPSRTPSLGPSLYTAEGKAGLTALCLTIPWAGGRGVLSSSCCPPYPLQGSATPLRANMRHIPCHTSQDALGPETR